MAAPYPAILVSAHRPHYHTQLSRPRTTFETFKLTRLDHKLVELWTRRHFRCDCPTTCMQPEPSASALPGSTSAKRRRCTLNPPQIQPAEDNSENRYNKNYKGEFCRCGREYDPLVETEGMLCCIGCEVS